MMPRWQALPLALAVLLCPLPVLAASAAPANTPTVSVFANDQEELSLGRSFLRQLRGSTPLLYDPLIQDWLENLGYRLAFFSGVAAPDLQVVLIPDRNINAFAVPGGVIGINVGLFLHADSEAEVASVLCHELAHISQRHYARSVDENSKNRWLYLGALLASIALAASNNSNAGMALGMSSQAALVQQQLTYSRQHEREADRIGMQTLVAAGYNPQAMADFFARLDRETRMVGFMPDFLLTHPLTPERISDSQLRANSYLAASSNGQHGVLDTPGYQAMRTRLLALVNPPDKDHIAQLQQRLASHPEDDDTRMALVLALQSQGDLVSARQTLAPLRSRKPNAIDVVVTAADIDLVNHQPAQALQTLQQALLLAPDSMPLRFYAAHAANQAGKPELALPWLESLQYQRPEDPQVWSELADTQQLLKNPVGVLRSRAEFHFLNGDAQKALRELDQAANLARDNYPLSARINHRRQEMQELSQQDKDNKS